MVGTCSPLGASQETYLRWVLLHLGAALNKTIRVLLPHNFARLCQPIDFEDSLHRPMQLGAGGVFNFGIGNPPLDATSRNGLPSRTPTVP